MYEQCRRFDLLEILTANMKSFRINESQYFLHPYKEGHETGLINFCTRLITDVTRDWTIKLNFYDTRHLK